jgi:glycogen debranching enzyme
MPYNANDFFELALVQNGIEIPYEWSASPFRLDLIASGDVSASFVFYDADTLLFETHGANLRLLPAKAFAAWWQPSADQIHLVDHPARGFHMFRASQGTGLIFTPSSSVYNLDRHNADRPITVEFTGKNGIQGAIRFSRFEGRWVSPLPDIDDTFSEREKQYEDWQNKMPVVAACYQETAEQAWFLLWNCQAPAGGALTRPAIYMSKFWMNSIWAWDNCFNALAVAGAEPHLAWQQLLLFFDHQDPNGMVPDMVNDLEPVYGFTKPPIHGWTIRKMVEITGHDLSLPYLEKIYKPLSRLVDWWYDQRDFDRDGLPQYHHGNDSGWDNATIFDQGFPTEGADLAAYLVLQSEALAFIAEGIGKPKAAVRWKKRAETQLHALLKHSVRKHRFYSPRDGQNNAPAVASLLNSIPIVLGNRLPDSILQTLSTDLGLTGPFLTEWGYASEAPSSPKYEPDGYWRGPIWAPSTFLIVDGLVAAGYLDLAREAATRFCDLCVKQPGFWENYDAITGAGLRCPGYSWTASVFLLLASWLKQEE